MKRHPLLAFFLLTFVFSWAVWMPLAAPGLSRFSISPRQAQMLGAFAPSLAALIVTAATGGVRALQALFGRLLIWRVGAAWYVAALLLPAGISLLTTALYTMFGGDAPNYAEPPLAQAALPKALAGWNVWLTLPPVFFQHLLFGTSLSEELAWRGFALPRLQQRHSALAASAWIGVLWALWVLPLYWGYYSAQGGAPVALALLGILPGQVLATWLFNNAKGSLLVLLLFNTALKVTDWYVTPSPAHPLVPVVAYLLAAAAVLAVAGPGTLSRRPLDDLCRRGDDAAPAATLEPALPAEGHGV